MTRQFRALSLRKDSVGEAIDVDHLLGAVTYGVEKHCSYPGSFGVVPMPVLSNHGIAHTIWSASGPFVSGSHGILQYRHDDNVLFGFIALEEADFPTTGERNSLQRASHAAYSAIFKTIEKTGFRYLAHCWNSLPGINVFDDGLERYRHFNIGRQDAFIDAQRSHLVGAPSSCALGTPDGGLVTYFLASHAEPIVIENPRQMSAYHYPDQHGPRSPTFSRATLLPLPGMEALLISGTASIVGHETRHHGDIAAQTAESLRNIEIIVRQANLQSNLKGFATDDLCMQVFIRHQEDLDTVAHVLREQLGDNLDVTYLQADICRADLLVEIEAFGYRDEELA